MFHSVIYFLVFLIDYVFDVNKEQSCINTLLLLMQAIVND